jgi:hypothetical protein
LLPNVLNFSIRRRAMKKYLISLFFVCVLAMPLVAKEEKKEAAAAPKIVLMNFAKGDMYSCIYGEQSLVEEHLVGKEKARMKVSPGKEKMEYAGSCGMFGMSKNVDWSKFNYLVCNVFVAGDKPWKGALLVGDKASYAKWANNYAGVDFVLKPGENKDVHIGIQGLFASNANRPLDMSNIQVWEFFPYDNPPPVIFVGNIYLVNEEE